MVIVIIVVVVVAVIVFATVASWWSGLSQLRLQYSSRGNSWRCFIILIKLLCKSLCFTYITVDQSKCSLSGVLGKLSC